MTMRKPFLSVIIPLFNEQERLKKIAKVYKFLNQQKFNFEVILINDGSTDNTLKILRKLSKKIKFTLITYGKNRGKGFAIKTGMMTAKGQYLLFTDIDLSTSIEEFTKFLPFLKKKNIIISSRKKEGSNLQKRQGFIRENLGKGFTLLSQIILNLHLSDFTCGFKCLPHEAAKKIFSRQKIERWGFDSEILFLAKKFGYDIIEIPVKWSNDPHTKVKFPQDIIRSLLDLYRIRYNTFKKIYE